MDLVSNYIVSQVKLIPGGYYQFKVAYDDYLRSGKFISLSYNKVFGQNLYQFEEVMIDRGAGQRPRYEYRKFPSNYDPDDIVTIEDLPQDDQEVK